MNPLFLHNLVYLAVTTGPPVPDSCKPTFFGLIPWYQYLTLKPAPDCGIKDGTFTTLGGNSSFLLIGLAIVDDLLRVAGMLAVFYVIYGGFRYITSQGSPEEAAKAQATIINGLIGLVIASLAVVAVTFIGNSL